MELISTGMSLFQLGRRFQSPVNDQAFFELQTRAKKLYLYLQKKEGMSVAQTLDQLVAGFVLSRDPPGDDIKHVIIDVVPCLFR